MPSSLWTRRMLSGSRCFSQLNDGEQLPREHSVNSICESSRLLKVRSGSLTPQDVSVRRVAHTSRNGSFYAGLDSVETLRGSLTGHVGKVSRIGVARQEFGSHCICSRDQIRWDAHYVGCKPGRDQGLDELVSGN